MSIFQLLLESLSQKLFFFKLVTRNIVYNLLKKSFDEPLKHIIQHIVCPCPLGFGADTWLLVNTLVPYKSKTENQKGLSKRFIRWNAVN